MACDRIENLSDGQRRWLEHIRACEASGQRMSEYAREHGLGQKNFYNAKTRLIKRGILKSKSAAVSFRRVELAYGPARFGCRVRLPNGVVVELELGSGAGGLGKLLEVVNAL